MACPKDVEFVYDTTLPCERISMGSFGLSLATDGPIDCGDCMMLEYMECNAGDPLKLTYAFAKVVTVTPITITVVETDVTFHMCADKDGKPSTFVTPDWSGLTNNELNFDALSSPIQIGFTQTATNATGVVKLIRYDAFKYVQLQLKMNGIRFFLPTS